MSAGWTGTARSFRTRPAGGVTGEASPYYVLHPHAPKRIAATAPGVKLILLIRHPVDRAYSHYHHEVAMDCEPLPFVDALEHETARLEGEVERMLADESYYSYNHQHYTYLARGRYAEQIRVWAQVVPQGNLLVIHSEEFYADPKTVLARVHAFLGVEDHTMAQYWPYNEQHPEPMDPAVRQRLLDYFAPFNTDLYGMLGADLGWNA